MSISRRVVPGSAGTVSGQAVQLDRKLRLSLAEHEFPAPPPGYVRIRVAWAGICGSDLTVARTGQWVRYWPAVLGHEVIGRIDALGEGVALPLGMAVVADSRFPCGRCSRCTTDRDLCRQMAHLGECRPGGFATYCLLPAENVVPVDEMDDSVAVLAEPLACCLHAIGRLTHAPEKVAILGHGPIGALVHIALLLRFPGVDVTVSELLPMRMKLAQAYGAQADDGAPDKHSFDSVFDTAGFPSSLSRALELCTDDGQAILMALPGGQTSITPSVIVEREIALCGSHAYTKELPQAVKMIAANPHMFRPVITEAVELSDLPEVMKREIESPQGCKVVIRP
jgi:2-desacetyl-2-hydroxyethyl bacteriochlorophyllide A dehydrogenase